MENEKQNQEERKGLTLADVGVPDYSFKQWKRLSPIERITQGRIIAGSAFGDSLDNVKSVDEPIGQEFLDSWRYDIIRALHSYYGAPRGREKTPEQWRTDYRHEEKVKDQLQDKLGFLEDGSLTARQIVAKLKEVAPTNFAFSRATAELVTGTPLRGWACPYFSNNFFVYFLNSCSEIYSNSKMIKHVQRLTQKHGYVKTRDSTKLQSWEGQRAIFPYYATLKRQGLKGVGA